MHRFSMLALAGSLSLALAGCNTTEVTSTLAQIQADCATVETGAQLVVTIASVAGGVSTTIPAAVGAGAAACSAILPEVTAAITAVTAAGQSAVVTVTTTSPKSGKRTVRRLTVTPGEVQTFVIPPMF